MLAETQNISSDFRYNLALVLSAAVLQNMLNYIIPILILYRDGEKRVLRGMDKTLVQCRKRRLHKLPGPAARCVDVFPPVSVESAQAGSAPEYAGSPDNHMGVWTEQTPAQHTQLLVKHTHQRQRF